MYTNNSCGWVLSADGGTCSSLVLGLCAATHLRTRVQDGYRVQEKLEELQQEPKTEIS
jgi:hypothetical protein